MKKELVITGADGITRSMVVTCGGIKKGAIIGGIWSPRCCCVCDANLCVTTPRGADGLGSGTFVPETGFPYPYFYDWRPVWSGGGAGGVGLRCCNPNVGEVAYRLKTKIEITWLGPVASWGRAWYEEIDELYDGRVSPIGTSIEKRTSSAGPSQGWNSSNAPVVTTQRNFDVARSCTFAIEHPNDYGSPYRPVGVIPMAFGAPFFFGRAPLQSVRAIDANLSSGDPSLHQQTPGNMSGSFYNGINATYGRISYTLNNLSGEPIRRVEASWEGYVIPACMEPRCTRSCCMPDGGCREGLSSDEECRGLGGEPNPLGLSCFEANCPGGLTGIAVGACCDLLGGCATTSKLDCQPPRVFHGFGTLCSSNPCGQAPGACCYGSGNSQCTVTDQVGCQILNGSWHGAGSACASGLCTSPRACCLPDGSCQDLQPEACLLAGGVGGAPNSSCGGAGFSCVGACCCNTSHGRTCGVTTRQACLAQQGCDFYGEGTVCVAGICDSPPGFRREGRLFVPRRKSIVVSGSFDEGCADCGKSVGF